MGLPSLREHIEEMVHLNSLAASGLGALARSEATAAELRQREQIVGGLVKRCQWVEATIADIRKGASEVGPEVGNYAHFLRSSLEQAKEKIAELTAEVTALRARLKVKPKKSKKIKKQERKIKKVAKRAAAKPSKREPIPHPTIGEKLMSHSFVTQPVRGVDQSFKHGRRKGVIVEKVVPRVRKGRN